MSQKLTKIFTSPVAGEDNDHIRISCLYDYLLEEISSVKVIVIDSKTGRGIDMTSIWIQEPFLSIVDDINWKEIYEETNLSNLAKPFSND